MAWRPYARFQTVAMLGSDERYIDMPLSLGRAYLNKSIPAPTFHIDHIL